MKIDIFAHILPERFLKIYAEKNSAVLEEEEVNSLAVTDLEVRLRLMERFPDVLQVLTLAQPPLERFVGPDDAAELARIGNDGLAELVDRYPNKFIGAAACVPMNNMPAALEETDRALGTLKMKGIQVYTRINGKPLDSPEFRPLLKKMAGYDLPIWLHPTPNPDLDEDHGVLSWPYETASAMYRLVKSGIFDEHPNLKFITHHCGSMIPHFANRLMIPGVKNARRHFRRFYVDTAVYGNTAALMNSYAFYDISHILYGTDMPLGPRYGLTGRTIESIERMDIPDEEKDKIFVKNAANLLALAY